MQIVARCEQRSSALQPVPGPLEFVVHVPAQATVVAIGEVAYQGKNGMLPLPEIASHAAQNFSQRIELAVTGVHFVDDFVSAEMLVTPHGKCQRVVFPVFGELV
jgi:hypothetical protein